MIKDFFLLKIKKNKVVETINVAVGLAVILAIISPMLTFFLIAPFDPSSIHTLVSMISLVIFLILALGTYLRNRIASVFLVVYYLLDRLIVFTTPNLNSSVGGATVVLSIFVTVVFVRGSKAVFIYHKYLKGKSRN